MGGGLIQLVAYGAQDVYLTGNPQITFFKVVYRRHTNFSVESIEQTFNGNPDFGKKVSCTISRNGDLIHKMLLEVELPSLDDKNNWGNYPGHRLINNVEVEIGGQRIDRHYGEWLHLWNQLTMDNSQSAGYNTMIGNTMDFINQAECVGNKVYIPLQFWFCRNPGLALPLIALQYHEVKINITFNERSKIMDVVDTTVCLGNCSLWVDYIFLDTDERRRFAQLSHEYLIEQVQFTGEEVLCSKVSKIKLPFNHPIKELVWVLQTDCSKNECNEIFNYTSSPEKNLFGWDSQYLNIFNSFAKATGCAAKCATTCATAWGPTPDAMDSAKACSDNSAINLCKKAKIQLNGQDRFSERDGNYFNYVQPYYHHTRTPAIGINTYSFALRPEEHQPSGTCNFSRIDNASITITTDTSGCCDGTCKNIFFRIYAVNYNVLRIMSGMGGLAYSN